ncbi:hypothetical protein [Nocardia beijingensis]|uniref:Uncharacterized protein n=1 Tax=Nocardia beijingensis TaxID=95162 RepID=A0ABW7W906_9NOCA
MSKALVFSVRFFMYLMTRQPRPTAANSVWRQLKSARYAGGKKFVVSQQADFIAWIATTVDSCPALR